jgi:hypothetical protein
MCYFKPMLGKYRKYISCSQILKLYSVFEYPAQYTDKNNNTHPVRFIHIQKCYLLTIMYNYIV